MTELSTGVMARIMHGEQVEKPVLQILGVKRITSNANSERFRLLMSDGKYYNSYTMLASQLNEMQHKGLLEEFAIVRLEKYITSIVGKNDSDKRVLIVTELTVLKSGQEVGVKMGDPITYEKAGQDEPEAKKPAATPATTAKKEPAKPSVYSNNNNNNNSYGSSFSEGMTHPISSLSPYQNKWVIKVRVTSKSPVRTWSNARGEGKLFSMDLMDESGEIRATAFKEQCDKFYDMIQVDNIYYISKCQLKPANKQYSQLKNDYELAFNGETVVQECKEDESEGIPTIKYDLVPISEVASMEDKATVDTIGICKDIGELQMFTSRTTNKEFKKRDVTIVDMSNAAINVTLWGDDAVNFDGHVQPVILVKGSRVNEFNGGKSLSLGMGAVLKINPDIPEGHKLRGWFDNGGGDNVSSFVSARTGGGSYNTEWMSFQEATRLGTGDKPDYFQAKGVVHHVKQENAFYKACPQTDCNKKLVDEGDGQYRCERCNQLFPNFKYRLLVNMIIGDWSASSWVTCFNDQAENLLKHSGQQIAETFEADQNAGSEIFAAAHFSSYVFKLRVKNEIYGDVSRPKVAVQSMVPINYKEYNKYLLNSLKETTGISTTN